MTLLLDINIGSTIVLKPAPVIQPVPPQLINVNGIEVKKLSVDAMPAPKASSQTSIRLPPLILILVAVMELLVQSVEKPPTTEYKSPELNVNAPLIFKFPFAKYPLPPEILPPFKITSALTVPDPDRLLPVFRNKVPAPASSVSVLKKSISRESNVSHCVLLILTMLSPPTNT